MALKLVATIANLASAGKTYLGATKTEIGSLVIDVTYASDIILSNTTSQNPTEGSSATQAGSYVSDNFYNDPTIVNLQCAILDSPIGFIATATSIIDILSGDIIENISNKYKGKGKNQIAAYKILTDMATQGTIMKLVAYNAVMDNMQITKVNFPRDSDTGNRLLFNITLEQKKFAEVLTVSIPVVSTRVNDLISSKLNLGSQSTAVPTALESNSAGSALKKVKDSIGSFASGLF